MKVMEFEGRELLFNSKIRVPFGRIIRDKKEIDNVLKEFDFPVVIKAQILSGKRGKSGAIKVCKDKDEAKKEIISILGKDMMGEKINIILVVEKLDIKKEYYVSYTFSTDTRTPVLMLCTDGGIDIEEHPDKVHIIPIDATIGMTIDFVRKILNEFNIKEDLSEFLVNLYGCFKKNDMLLTEVNPLIITKDDFYAADFKGILDDEALSRHKFNFPKRTGTRELTELEKKARKIDEEDYRGVAGKTFIELDGDIAYLASGGGCSITAADAIMSYGENLANFTEYSGNPSGEKVKKLTEITLSKPNLSGCFVVGGRANFTRIDETLKGFLDALIKIRPDYPIVIRRDGPGKEEAFEMLEKAAKENDLDIHLFGSETPITKAAEIMVELVREYKKKKGKT